VRSSGSWMNSLQTRATAWREQSKTSWNETWGQGGILEKFLL
jgi:hypothetical protein